MRCSYTICPLEEREKETNQPRFRESVIWPRSLMITSLLTGATYTSFSTSFSASMLPEKLVCPSGPGEEYEAWPAGKGDEGIVPNAEEDEEVERSTTGDVVIFGRLQVRREAIW